MKKKKIKKTMKKNKMVFISAEFSLVCWVLPSDMALMSSEAGISQCQVLTTSSSCQPVLGYK